jgi:hypothetical protein
MRQRGLRFTGWLLMGALLIGCRRSSTSVLPSATAPTATVEPQLDLKPLTPLLSNRPTHLSMDPQGNLYWVQETEAGADTMFVMGSSGIPAATSLSSASIAQSLDAATDAHGNILSICAGPAGEIYFYFRGASRGQLIAALGAFSPGPSPIRILADTSTLETATEMGRSLALAGGTLINDGQNIWFWVHHTDSSRIFRFNPRGLSPGVPLILTPAFTHVMLDDTAVPLTDDTDRLVSSGRSELMVLDPDHARLLRIDSNGHVMQALSLLGLPGALSPPVIGKRGQIILFAASSPPLGSSRPDDRRKVWQINATPPALLMFDNTGNVSAIGRDHINAYPGFPVFGLRLTDLISDPTSDQDRWIGYDANSGQVLRLAPSGE